MGHRADVLPTFVGLASSSIKCVRGAHYLVVSALIVYTLNAVSFSFLFLVFTS